MDTVEAGQLGAEAEDPSTTSSPASPENSTEDSPTCPARPSPDDCPFPQWSPEWKNWYAHFGCELVRWGRYLSQKIIRTPDDASSIKWKALGLHNVRKQQDPIAITRITNQPVVKTTDSGITVTENCDIVTYDGTGVLINKGKGVVINGGSGIVINHSKGTCNNAANGIIISLGKGLLVNTGPGYGIIKTCAEATPEERVVLNEAGGIVIKDASELLKICEEERANEDVAEVDEDLEDDDDEDLSVADTESDEALELGQVLYFDNSESEASLEDYPEIDVFLTEASDFTTSLDEDEDGSDDGISIVEMDDVENNNNDESHPQLQEAGTPVVATAELSPNQEQSNLAIACSHPPEVLSHSNNGQYEPNASDLESDSVDKQDQESADDEQSSLVDASAKSNEPAGVPGKGSNRNSARLSIPERARHHRKYSRTRKSKRQCL